MVIILFIIVLVIILSILKLKGKTGKQTQHTEYYPYKSNRYLLTKAEKSFYNVLKMALDEKYYICPKVRLADILYVTDSNKKQTYFNKIVGKHIDFVICEADSLSPIFVIELDDSSHERQDRKNRDDFLNKALKFAGMPILRIKASYSYNPKHLKDEIQEILDKRNVA